MSKKPAQTASEMQATFRAFFESHNTQPERTMQGVEDEARGILRDEGYPDDWRAFAYTVTKDGRPHWECTEDEIRSALDRLDPAHRSDVYLGQPLTPRADLARRALIEVTAWRHAHDRGDARWTATFSESARRLLEQARLHSLEPMIRAGEATSLGGKRAQADAAPDNADRWKQYQDAINAECATSNDGITKIRARVARRLGIATKTLVRRTVDPRKT